MTWQIWFACAVVVLAVLALVKRYETRMVLVLAGLAMCAAAGEPIKAFQAFVKGMTNVNLVPAICSAMGFAAVVTATKCDQHLVAAVAAPLKKLGGLLIPVTTVLTFCINIAIMSAAGTAADGSRCRSRTNAGADQKRNEGGAGTMSGLLLNPGCAHDIYVAKMANMDLMAFIGWAAPYVVGLVLLGTLVNAALAIFHYKDHKPSAEEMANLNLSDKEAFKVNYLRALAPLVPLMILMSASIWFPKAGIDVVAAMLIGIVVIALITMMNPGEISKAFFKGMGSGYAQVIGLIVAAGVFTAGLQTTGTVGACIEALKSSNDLARWGAAIGPFLMAVGTGSGEAAIWAFNQAVTPLASSFGMESHSLGLLAIMAGQFGRTASPLAGCIIIVAGMAAADPVSVAKRLFPGMLVAMIVSAFILV